MSLIIGYLYSMSVGVQLKLTALGLAVGLMGALIVVITLSSQQQASELRARLSDVDSESSGISGQFRDSLRELNSALLHYGVENNPAIWRASLNASLDLDAWIYKQKGALHTPAETGLLQQIETAYNDYLQAIWDFHTRVRSLGGRSASLADFAPVRERSQRLFDLGQTLAATHREAQYALLKHANRSLERLHSSVLILVGLLFAFGTAMAVGVYQHLIAPLHVKLVKTQAFAEEREKLASLGLLATGIAHEVRNPLRSIKIGMFFQKNKFPPGTTERADAEVVEQEILRLERILDGFLMSTLPAAPELAPLQLNAFLRELSHFFTPQLAVTNIRLVTEILAPMQVRADAAQLKQVIVNLIQNAVHNIGCNGQITLRARPDRKLLSGSETEVAILEVADTDDEVLPEAETSTLKPFFPAQNDGAGMGLSIASQIVQNHGGELFYQTRLDRSTVFGIVLPQISA
jgi:signal transduction histidine kinase